VIARDIPPKNAKERYARRITLGDVAALGVFYRGKPPVLWRLARGAWRVLGLKRLGWTPTGGQPPCLARWRRAASNYPNADYFCFVALDLRLLLMRPVSSITASTVRIAPEEFNEENQQKTVREMLAEQA
jgi:hypothetical protein